jgi:hypothetical protein
MPHSMQWMDSSFRRRSRPLAFMFCLDPIPTSRRILIGLWGSGY